MGIREGHRWEDIAGEYLEREGLHIVERRFRCRLGELDLVCRHGALLVVVEVRARSRNALVPAADSIDRRKRMRIVQATRYLLMRHAEWYTAPLRFDVVTIEGIDTPHPAVHWIKNAFDADGL